MDYTVLAASSGPITILPLLQKVGYDVEQHFTPVALTGRSPFVLVSAPSFKAATAREFVALAREPDVHSARGCSERPGSSRDAHSE
uniref:Uncharacterized protein n=1 Tax=uncultured bacterium 888 TaxID=548896 RepID=B8R8Q6_9BACT|nr:hypothetical protein [uncultured bacterium 888]